LTRRNGILAARRFAAILCLLALCPAIGGQGVRAVSADARLRDKLDLREDAGDTGFSQLVRDFVDYAQLQARYAELGLQAPDVPPLVLPVRDAVRSNGDPADPVAGYAGRTGDVLLWDDGEPSYEWSFLVSEEGLYEIEVEYYPLPDAVTDIQRSLYIDGENPCRQANNVFFNRNWVETGDILTTPDGDQKAPRLKQAPAWSATRIRDSVGMYPDALQFHFSKGRHTVRLGYVNSPLAIAGVRILPASSPPSYAEVEAGWGGDAVPYDGAPLVLQAEEAAFRSHRILRRIYDSDPGTTPSPRGNVVMNAIGGGRWNTGNQEIAWTVDVPEDGLYRLGFRVRQGFSLGISVHRRIEIDGGVPYAELLAYPFEYDDQWRTRELLAPDGSPMLVRLDKGTHTISMSVVTGQLTPLINELEDMNFLLSDILQDITTVTSTVPDPNFDYRLDKTIPWIIDDLKALSARLKAQADYVDAISSRRPPVANTLASTAAEVDGLVRSPSRIPAKLNDMFSMQTTLSSWFTELRNQPLSMDYLVLAPAGRSPADPRTSLGQKLLATLRNFLQSFTKDYYRIDSSRPDDPGDRDVLEVWVSRAKEWAELLQQLVDEDFTRDTGILVDVNMLPPASTGAAATSPLMLSVISGKAPDVALGSDGGAPVEYAIRQSTVDLSAFDDFEEVSARFLPGAMIPLGFRGGVYALPETMDFPLLFYRSDIVSRLGIELPDTWEDVFRKTLPSLRQNGTQMFMRIGFDAFLFQNGGQHYRDNGTRSALDSEAAYKSFVQWTDAYVVYRMELAADLLNHFRIGSIPIAIGTMGDYITISRAAPQIYGRWSIRPIPGTLRPDGTIDRTAGGGISTAMIMAQTGMAEEAWAFLKWWTSAETQVMFGSEIEAIVGPEARWLSANLEAFRKIGWNPDHLAVMEESWKWFRNPQNVLGGYFTGRHLLNAWTRVVLGNSKARDSLEVAIEAINRELDRKNEEYRDIYGLG